MTMPDHGPRYITAEDIGYWGCGMTLFYFVQRLQGWLF
jgi:hypothetical protein